MTIEIIVLLTLLLILMQIFIPVTIDLLITKKLNFLYLFSSRDDVAESSLFFDRSQRALKKFISNTSNFYYFSSFINNQRHRYFIPSYIMAGYAFYLCSYLHPWYWLRKDYSVGSLTNLFDYDGYQLLIKYSINYL